MKAQQGSTNISKVGRNYDVSYSLCSNIPQKFLKETKQSFSRFFLFDIKMCENISASGSVKTHSGRMKSYKALTFVWRKLLSSPLGKHHQLQLYTSPLWYQPRTIPCRYDGSSAGNLRNQFRRFFRDSKEKGQNDLLRKTRGLWPWVNEVVVRKCAKL